MSDHVWKSHIRPIIYGISTAAVIATLLWSLSAMAAEASAALAQEVAPPALLDAPVRSLDAFAALSALSVVLVITAVRAARALVPWLTRDDPRAKLACQGIGLAVAVVCAMLGLAPAVDPLGAAHPLVAQGAGGVIVAALASWGRDGLARLPGAVAGPSK